jgi:putative ABC transport system permease protein
MINIVGLAMGLASCLLLLLYVNYEWRFDKQFKGAGQVYQVMTNFEDAKGKITGTGDATGNTMADFLKENIPGVETAARIGYGGLALIANKENSYKREAKFADPGILAIYHYQFIQGNPKTALNEPKSVVLTEETAKTLFGSTDVLNKDLKYDNKTVLKITGVIKDLPSNMSNRFDLIMPWSFYESLYDWVKEPSWTNFNWQTIVKVTPEADIDQINAKIKNLIKKNSTTKAESFLFPLANKHLYGQFVNGKSVGGNIERIYLFIGLALGILLIACINFMNMATAKSERRAKEVGIKKTIGASRSSLVTQFLTESMLLTVMAVLISVVIVETTLPTFNHLLNIKLSISYSNLSYWLGIVGVVLITGFLSGSYPALYLSSFNPIQILRRKAIGAKKIPFSLRQVLVVGQFCFAIMLIIATMVIYKQIQFIKNRPVGYDINSIVEMQQDGEMYSKFEVFKSELLKKGAVTAVNQSSGSIAHDGSNFWNFEWPGMAEADKQIVFNQIATAYDFIKTNGVKLLAGRDFSEKFASDSAAVLLSSTAVEKMNLKNPVGTMVKYHGNNAKVVGVFGDFIWGSPYYRDRPMVIAFSKDWSGNITMRLNPENSLSKNIEIITQVSKQINPAYPVDIKFVNELYAEKLQAEKILGILSNLFGGLAIFISCLGLFGLTAYSAEQRTKEFGVRRVLGASISSIMNLLSISFMKMVLIAVFIGVPVAYYFMNQWLSHFEYRTTISWSILLTGVFGTMIIAFATVSLQSYRAATANPVSALKYE